jgi:hypothetical protein
MRFEGLKSRYPEMADEEARALAQDPASFREIMKTPKVDTQVVETAEGQILINKLTGQPIANIGKSPDRRSITTTNILPPDTRGKAFEKADTDTLAGLRTSATAAAGQLGLIQQARDQVAASAVTGVGVPSVVRSLNNVLAPLGINAEQVANTRNLEQALNSIIAQGIKQYGANPSTVDLEFAKRASASITDPKLAIQQTLDYLEQRASEIINKTDAAEQYLLERGNLAGFEKQWINQSRVSRLTGQDREAYNWAMSNPNDPRSADIKKRLGVQ